MPVIYQFKKTRPSFSNENLYEPSASDSLQVKIFIRISTLTKSTRYTIYT